MQTQTFLHTQQNPHYNYDDAKEHTVVFLIHDTQCHMTIDLTAPETKCHIKILVVDNQESKSTLDLQVNLLADKTFADITIINLLADKAHSHIDANIHIAKNTQDAEGHLHEDIVILWESVHIHTTPQLDIHANQVKASHGAAIHRIDGNNLFYLSSKWLSRSQAEKLLVDWYIDQICNTVAQDTQQTYKDTVHAVLYATTG